MLRTHASTSADPTPTSWEPHDIETSSPPRDPLDQDYGEAYVSQMIDPTEAEREVLEAMSRESKRNIKDCMQWEKRVLHSSAMTLITPESIQEHYRTPTLPYPLAGMSNAQTEASTAM